MQDFHMQLALEEAQKALKHNEVPVGAVIYDNHHQRIIARAGNTVEQHQNPTAHAEINAILQASQHNQSSRLNECDIYVTLEPCPMCAFAISLARIRRVYFAAYDPKGGGIDHGPKIYQSTSCHHRPEVYGGLREKEASDLLKTFFLAKRV